MFAKALCQLNSNRIGGFSTTEYPESEESMTRAAPRRLGGDIGTGTAPVKDNPPMLEKTGNRARQSICQIVGRFLILQIYLIGSADDASAVFIHVADFGGGLPS